MEILKNFGIQPVLLLAQIVNFLIILFVLKKFFYKPIVRALENRKKRIEESLANAQVIEEKLQKTDEKTNQILESARNNAQALIAQARDEAQRIADQATAEGRQIIEAAKIEAKAQMEIERRQLEKQLERQTTGLVVAVVKKVLGRTLKVSERRKLTTKATTELARRIQ